MFGVAVYTDNATIVSSGINVVLSSIDEIEMCDVCTDCESVVNLMKTGCYQILIVVLKDVSNSDIQFELINQIRAQFYRIRIVAVAPKACKDLVFKSIKCGANGFLSADASVQELKEAVFTIRAGHEFFSASITKLLVNNYVESMRTDSADQIALSEKLGKRELEVLSLWGDGHTNVEIADTLFISVRTVESHKNHIMQKLGIRTTVDLLKFAIRNNITSL
jgi:DNA-binding NarL/FixJ family response regulator